MEEESLALANRCRPMVVSPHMDIMVHEHQEVPLVLTGHTLVLNMEDLIMLLLDHILAIRDLPDNNIMALGHKVVLVGLLTQVGHPLTQREE